MKDTSGTSWGRGCIISESKPFGEDTRVRSEVVLAERSVEVRRCGLKSGTTPSDLRGGASEKVAHADAWATQHCQMAHRGVFSVCAACTVRVSVWQLDLVAERT